MNTVPPNGLSEGLRTDLSLFVDEALVPRFHTLLQAGVLVRVRVGTSIGRLLREQLALRPETIERVSTIFLDGKPVDDIETVMTKEGSTLALSSAMPGLVGATMRRQGFYASFRSSITHRPEDRRTEEKEGLLRIKVFNLLMAEMGPLFLERGVYVLSEDLERFLQVQPDRFFEGITQAVLDGRQIPLSSIRAALTHTGTWVRLKVCISL